MNTQDGHKYLQNLNLRDGVRKQLEMKMQDKKEAENWWNKNWHTNWGMKQDIYNYIHKQNFREGVLKKVMEMFDRQYGRPLQ